MSNRKCFKSTSAKNSFEIVPKNVLELHERGLLVDIHPDASPDLPKLLQKKKQTFYSGFDPTADSLHVGNLVPLMILLHCQRSGHNVIALIGTATAKAGDPTGRLSDRDMLSMSEIDRNAQGIARNIHYVFNNYANDCFDAKETKNLPPLKVVYNEDWHKKNSVIDFVGMLQNFRVAQLMSMRSVRDRVNSSESMLASEFIYPVLQSHDWLHLHDKHNCNFQVGGIDQLCNVNSGVKLIRKNRPDSKEVYGLFTPLVTTPKGEKLGKSAGNSVWLCPKKTSPFEFYQYFFRQPDSVVENFLKYFTFLSLKDIREVMHKHTENPKLQGAQTTLANHVTKLVHGKTGLKFAERCTRALFGGKAADLEQLSQEEISETFAGTDIVDVVLEPDTTVLDALKMAKVLRMGEKEEHLVKTGSIKINGEVVSEPHQILLHDLHVLANNISLITVGKKRHYLLRWSLPRVTHKRDDHRNDPLDRVADF